MRCMVKGKNVTWVDIQNPTKEDINYLKEKFDFHPLVLGELMPPGHRPKVEHHKDYLFMILYYPIYDRIKRETRSRELDIIVTKNILITSHYKFILPLKALFDICNIYEDSRKNYMDKNTGFLLFHILSGFWNNCLVKLEQIEKRLDFTEKEMFRGKEKEMVGEISFIKTDIINFWRIIEPQGPILNSLLTEGISFFGEELSPYFNDILGTYGRAWNEIKTYKETILALEDTNQSLLSTKTNETIKVLTIFSVIVLPLTLMASIWGMNVPVPWSDSPFGFWFILGIMAVSLVLMFLFFKKRQWI
jgi:magnesium transporter